MKQKKKPKQHLFLKFLLMASMLLFSLLAIDLLHTAVIRLNRHASEKSALSASLLPDRPDAGGRTLPRKNPAAENGTENGRGENGSTKDGGTENGSTKKDTAENSRTKKNSAETAETPAQDVSVVFTGDIYLSDYVLAAYNQYGIRGVLSEDLLKELTNADIAMANNEFPFSTRGTPAPNKQFTFRVDPSYTSVLKDAGIDIVSLANNHVLDYGADALTDTFQALDTAGIAYAGAGSSFERAGKLITKKAGGRVLGFLSASRVFPEISWNVKNAQPGVFSAYEPKDLTDAVRLSRSQCDFLCVYVHWGIERNTTPEEYQVSLAHALIDAGADAVIGAHPHVLQGVEFYNGKPVFYSLGNFIFYQNIEQTAILKLTLGTGSAARWQLLPASAANACTALDSDASSCQNFCRYMSGLSDNADFLEDGTVVPGSR